jgi:molybdopterin/thiamine biosynthesis adenylyltransferase/rhodanese-related sulfurtransferase
MDKERYSRHISLTGFGLSAQEKLLDAKVLVIGAGGLGCPALQYLAAAGVGMIGIADDDVVSLSNLQRQVLYTVDDLGLPKVTQAAIRLGRQNPEITIHAHGERITVDNALELLAQYDVIVDGTDNFASRYLINDACYLLNKPLVFAAVYQYEGQLAVLNVTDADGQKTNYRDLFPNAPTADEAPDCNAAGVLGVLPGMMGMMQANEVIKLIAGIGKPLLNQLLTYNALTAESYVVHISADPAARSLIPQGEDAFKAMDYEWLCAAPQEEVSTLDTDIDAAAFERYKQDEHAVFVDVREFGEWPPARFPHVQIPISQLKTGLEGLEDGEVAQKDRIVIFCKTGRRSQQAAKLFQAHFGGSKEIYSLEGGMVGLDED